MLHPNIIFFDSLHQIFFLIFFDHLIFLKKKNLEIGSTFFSSIPSGTGVNTDTCMYSWESIHCNWSCKSLIRLKILKLEILFLFLFVFDSVNFTSYFAGPIDISKLKSCNIWMQRYDLIFNLNLINACLLL